MSTPILVDIWMLLGPWRVIAIVVAITFALVAARR
jgi:hypothetical protein